MTCTEGGTQTEASAEAEGACLKEEAEKYMASLVDELKQAHAAELSRELGKVEGEVRRQCEAMCKAQRLAAKGGSGSKGDEPPAEPGGSPASGVAAVGAGAVCGVASGEAVGSVGADDADNLVTSIKPDETVLSDVTGRTPRGT